MWVDLPALCFGSHLELHSMVSYEGCFSPTPRAPAERRLWARPPFRLLALSVCSTAVRHGSLGVRDYVSEGLLWGLTV